MLALGPPGVGNAVSGQTGIFPGGTVGPGLPNRCAVSPAGAMTVAVSGGQYCVDRGIALGMFLGSVTGSVTVTHPSASPTNPRIDYVVIRTRDPGVDSNVTESAKIVILSGNAAPVPPEPSDQLTSGDVLLAAVTVRAGTVAIVATDISDRRVFVTARGGVTPYNPALGKPVGSYEGQYFDNSETEALERWDGTKLVEIAQASPWVEFTPVLTSQAGPVYLGPGGIAEGAYQKLGKTLNVRYYFQAFRPCNLGFGQIYTLLPAGFVATTAAGPDFYQHGRAQLNTEPPGIGYQSWYGDAGIYAGSNAVLPSFPLSASQSNGFWYQVAAQAGVPGGGIPNLPNEFPDPLRGLGLQLTIQIQ